MIGVNGRKLSPELRTYFDGLYSQCQDATDAPTTMVRIAKLCVGITEQGGDNRGKLVELLQSTVGGANGEPWCLAFLQSLLAYAEEKFGQISELIATEHCLTLWNAGECRQYTPEPGDFVIWEHGNTGKGHCGIIVSVDSLRLETVEGNTSAIAEIERNGDGVFKKFRARGGSKTFRELGFLRPFIT